MKIRLLLVLFCVLSGLAFLATRAQDKKEIISKTQSVSLNTVQTSSLQKNNLDIQPEKPVARAPAEIIKLSQIEKLNQFRLIQAKVFKSETETEVLKSFVSDPVVIHDLASYLLNQTQIKRPDFRENQNAAIDLILESLKSSHPEPALEAILAVVKDSQVENNLIENSVRESLAGTKAELLFQGSALRPDLFANIDQVLPGPVSQKIWKNIQQKQIENASESEIERKERLNSKI